MRYSKSDFERAMQALFAARAPARKPRRSSSRNGNRSSHQFRIPCLRPRDPRVLPISSPALCRPVKAAASAGWGRTIIFWKIGAALARCEKGLSGAAQAAFWSAE
jgi:hypothetical protein